MNNLLIKWFNEWEYSYNLHIWQVNILWLMPMAKLMVIQELFVTKNSRYVLTKRNPIYNWRKLSRKGPRPFTISASWVRNWRPTGFQYTLSKGNNKGDRIVSREVFRNGADAYHPVFTRKRISIAMMPRKEFWQGLSSKGKTCLWSTIHLGSTQLIN